MTTEPILDFDTLLAPIPGDNPAGEDLRADASFSSPLIKIKDAWKDALAAERQQTYSEEQVRIPEWRAICASAPALIATRSKDLEIACSLADALVREKGFSGLRDGVRLIHGLVREYWDGLYPLEDEEEGLDARTFPLRKFLGVGNDPPLFQALRKIPITGQDKGGGISLSSWHYEMAVRVGQAASEEERARLEGNGIPTKDVFEKHFKENTVPFVRGLVEDMTATLQCLDELEGVLSERCGSSSSLSLSGLRDLLGQIMGLVRTLGAKQLAEADRLAEAETGSAAQTMPGEQTVTGGSVPMPGAINSRDQAFKTLLDVAGFFRRTEPQSFIPVMLENVVRRGQMSLFDLLLELVPEDGCRQDMLVRAGISHVGSDNTENQS